MGLDMYAFATDKNPSSPVDFTEGVKRLAMLTPNRRPKLTPLCARYWAR